MSSNREGKATFTTEDIISALNEARGGIFLAADKIGCSYKTIERRAKDVQAVKDTILKWRGRRCDRAEIALDAALSKHEPWAILFTLKTQGKDRGYVERQEVSTPDGQPLKVIVEYVTPQE